MVFFFLGTVSYTIDQVVLGNEYFGVQSNGDFYVKNGLTAFSSGTTLTVTATVADTGGLQGRSKKICFNFFNLFKNCYQWMVLVNFILPFFLENLLVSNSFNIPLPYVNILMFMFISWIEKQSVKNNIYGAYHIHRIFATCKYKIFCPEEQWLKSTFVHKKFAKKKKVSKSFSCPQNLLYKT